MPELQGGWRPRSDQRSDPALARRSGNWMVVTAGAKSPTRLHDPLIRLLRSGSANTYRHCRRGIIVRSPPLGIAGCLRHCWSHGPGTVASHSERFETARRPEAISTGSSVPAEGAEHAVQVARERPPAVEPRPQNGARRSYLRFRAADRSAAFRVPASQKEAPGAPCRCRPDFEAARSYPGNLAQRERSPPRDSRSWTAALPPSVEGRPTPTSDAARDDIVIVRFPVRV